MMKEYLVQLLNKTKLDIPVISVAITLAGASLGFHFNSYLNQKYQTIFSEISQRQVDAQQTGREINSLTDLACATIDIPNNVFEAYNESVLNPTSRFSEKLRAKYDDIRFSHNLKNMTSAYAQQTQNVRAQINANAQFVDATSKAAQELDRSVEHHESNIYLPLPETRLRTDSKGKTRLTTTIVMKHVATKHRFTLDKDAANRGIDIFYKRGEFAQLDYTISPTSRINEQNIEAIQKSADSELTKEQAKSLAKSWVLNYVLANDMRDLNQRAAQVSTLGPNLEQAVSTGPTDYKKTVYTPAAAIGVRGTIASMAVGSIEGNADAPPEHTVIKSGASNLGASGQVYGKINGTLSTSQKHVDEIKKGLEALTSANYSYTNKDENEKIADKILDEARELYSENCPTLAKYPTPRWFLPLIGSLIGGALGLLAGFKVDSWAENQRKETGFPWPIKKE